MNPIIFVDMDEVLADFIGAACRIHGTTREAVEAARVPGVWSITVPMGLSLSQFWAPIHEAGEDFWLGIEPLPWFDEVVRIVSDTTDDWHIVSAPSLDESCYSGKIKWLRRMFGTAFDQFVLTPHKHIFASPGRYLIDDRERNIKQFTDAGGTGILFPNSGNRYYLDQHDPIRVIRTFPPFRNLSCTR